MSGSQSILDPRMLKIVITVGSNQYTFEDNGVIQPALALTAKGTKYANAIKNECTVTIGNVDTDTKNLILTETSPFIKTSVAKSIAIYAGRVSKGYALVYLGDFTFTNPTQPPDVLLTLKTATASSKNAIIGVNRGSRVMLSQVAGQVASGLGLSLNFSATDKNVSNYAYTGSQIREVDKLGDLGPVDAYIDDNQLIVKNIALPLPNAITTLDVDNGLVGVPEVTEEGVRIKFMYDNVSKLGGRVDLTSILNPSLNGSYTIYKLGFDLSNRDTPFYYDASCINPALAANAAIQLDDGNDNLNQSGIDDGTT